MPTKTLSALMSWSGVAWWTLMGTLACIVVSLAFNIVMFGDLGPAALRRALYSATVLPPMLAAPLFFCIGLRMRGMALTNKHLGMVARTDSLTACLNRGAFTARVTALLDLHQTDSAGALLMIDADNFKRINDLFGHDNGDAALASIARSIRAVVRPTDFVGRIGGEEFAVYLPDASQHEASILAERIRRSVNLAAFIPDGRQRPLSVSIGGVAFRGRSSFAELFRAADQRLYKAKQSGRNRVLLTHIGEPLDMRPVLETVPLSALPRSA